MTTKEKTMFNVKIINTNNVLQYRTLLGLSLSQVGRIDSMLPAGWIVVKIVENNNIWQVM